MAENSTASSKCREYAFSNFEVALLPLLPWKMSNSYFKKKQIWLFTVTQWRPVCCSDCVNCHDWKDSHSFLLIFSLWLAFPSDIILVLDLWQCSRALYHKWFNLYFRFVHCWPKPKGRYCAVHKTECQWQQEGLGGARGAWLLSILGPHTMEGHCYHGQ